MNFSITPLLIDIIAIIVTILFMVYGYFKGFIVRLYDLLATFLAFFIALFFSAPLSTMIVLYKVSGILSLIGNVINRLLVFVMLFTILRLVFWVIGKFIRPLIKSVISKIGIIKKFDHFFGVILGFIQALIFIYIALILVISPLFINGETKIEKTIVAKNILSLVPTITNEVKYYTNNFNIIDELIDEGINYEYLSGDSIYNISLWLNRAYESKLISKEQLAEYTIKFYQDIDQVEVKIVLDQIQYNEVIKLFTNISDDKLNKQKILDKMMVKE